MIPHSRPWITNEDEAAVTTSLRSGMIAQGEAVRKFENAVAQKLAVDRAVAAGSGTSALELAVRALDLAPGTQIVMPSYVCGAVYQAVRNAGAEPVLCDVDGRGLMTLDTVKPLLSGSTGAIIAVHLFGLPCNIRDLEECQIPIIEDACQSFGLNLDEGAAGGAGTIGVLSFHATKCITTGEGGMLVTSQSSLAERALLLRDGRGCKNTGVAAPISDLQASLGLAQLARHDTFVERRHQLRDRFQAIVANSAHVETPQSHPSYLFRFIIRGNFDLKDATKFFESRGVTVRRGVDQLLHRMIGLPDLDFPTTCWLYDNTLSIPFYPALTEAEIDTVAGALEEFVR